MPGEITFDSLSLIALSAIYFLPAIVAASRKHHQSSAIFALNLFLGLTGLGWIGALVWASTRVIHGDVGGDPCYRL
jgi:hypothetical protein